LAALLADIQVVHRNSEIFVGSHSMTIRVTFTR
jgi:hypothetical protein